MSGYDDFSGYSGWGRYVPVSTRRSRARKIVDDLERTGKKVQPISIEGRTIARTFWGRSWCEHLESFSDYRNRLPRGRTYVRNGSVCHLEIAAGAVTAMVSGSSMYHVKIAVEPLPAQRWLDVKRRCAGRIGSLIELLQGRLSDEVMEVVTNVDTGLFPLPSEIKLHCTCPDWAVMCKHVCAALYGVGSRLDESPELLFLLRGVDSEQLISADSASSLILKETGERPGGREQVRDDELSDIFGIELVVADGSSPDIEPSLSESRFSSSGKTGYGQTGSGKADRDAAGRPPRRSGFSGFKSGIPTGPEVQSLRESLELNKSEFARLVGVSAASVANWERKRGPLSLAHNGDQGLKAAAKLTRRKAWKLLKKK
ncbi:MAG: hypothetical protein IPM23_21705 [Candidatus Melainabacteria bacterium]|nr:hypothetical protein [Candidatus Melainabacteria bacterium]